MVINDWVREVAVDIAIEMADNEQKWAYYVTGAVPQGLVAWVEGRIRDHCPFKPDTAYEEVKRA